MAKTATKTKDIPSVEEIRNDKDKSVKAKTGEVKNLPVPVTQVQEPEPEVTYVDPNKYRPVHENERAAKAELIKIGRELHHHATQLEGPLTCRMTVAIADHMYFHYLKGRKVKDPESGEVIETQPPELTFKDLKGWAQDNLGITKVNRGDNSLVITQNSTSIRGVITVAVKGAMLLYSGEVPGLHIDHCLGSKTVDPSKVKGAYKALVAPWNVFEPNIVHGVGKNAKNLPTPDHIVKMPGWAIDAQYAKAYEGQELSDTGRKSSTREGQSGQGSANTKTVFELSDKTKPEELAFAFAELVDAIASDNDKAISVELVTDLFRAANKVANMSFWRKDDTAQEFAVELCATLDTVTK